MTLIIELSPEAEERLQREAARHGQPSAAYARTLLESSVTNAEWDGASPPSLRSLDELMAMAQEQGVCPVERFEDLLGPAHIGGDVDVDDFMALRREWRRRPAGFADGAE